MTPAPHPSPVERAIVKGGLVMGAIGLALAALMASCADPLTAARNAVTTAASVQRDVVGQFVTWDKVRQDEIVRAATTREQAEHALAAYRAERAKVVTSVRALWLATVATETAINLAEAGQKDPRSLAGYVGALVQTVNDLVHAAQMLGVPVPGV